MTWNEFRIIEDYMLHRMKDSVHDKHHIYRVLYSAVEIAHREGSVDADVLIAACLLHDIGREQQFTNPKLCHAQIGSEMALDFLLSQNWSVKRAFHVKDCISSHRYRGATRPKVSRQRFFLTRTS